LVSSSIELIDPEASIYYDEGDTRVEIDTTKDGLKKQFHFKLFNINNELNGSIDGTITNILSGGYIPLSQSFNNDFNNDFTN
jgi:hypothetical protein